jgi:uncharacterized repeat protein (TIGR03803 family)
LTLSGSTLYGMTSEGGTNTVVINGLTSTAGVIFQISTNGAGYAIMHQFGSSANDGGWPDGSLILSGSILYGMTGGGGTNGDGVIFQIGTNGTGYTILHQFGSSNSDGQGPEGSLTLSGSTLYGMTSFGGTNDGGDGVIFQISTNGTGYAIMHQFGSSPSDGEFPEGSLTLSGSTLYGMTSEGGTNGYGVIFSLGGVGLALQITSITQTGNDIAISWTTGGIGSTNELQAAAGAADGNYNTNNFPTIFAVTNVVGPATNYLDVGGATNTPARYYRVASP